MVLWTGFLLGLFGSAHCAGMCGPLALALPAAPHGRIGFLASRLAYNAGRITAYGVLGVLVGLVGRTFAVAGLQRWASLGAGAVILLSMLASSRSGFAVPAFKTVAWLKAGLAPLLRKRTLPATFLLGGLNGLLPCGLVYVACAGAVALGGLFAGVAYMTAFGLGTLPLMLGIGLAGKNLQLAIRGRFQRLIPICVLMLGLLLILRGMSLGIPYVSPDLKASYSAARCCH
jgi:sulfite exporter TauE/SafE